jgi:hypothetical protein
MGDQTKRVSTRTAKLGLLVVAAAPALMCRSGLCDAAPSLKNQKNP